MITLQGSVAWANFFKNYNSKEQRIFTNHPYVCFSVFPRMCLHSTFKLKIYSAWLIEILRRTVGNTVPQCSPFTCFVLTKESGTQGKKELQVE